MNATITEVGTNDFLELMSNKLDSHRPKDEDKRVLSFFCGGGGLDIGIEAAGFKICLSTDISPQLCDILRENVDHKVEPIDIRDFNKPTAKELTGYSDFDLLIGGPPCQAFSILGQRNSFNDPRGQLVFEYGRVINELRPKAFIFENVPGIMTVNKGKDWKELLGYFRDATKYNIFCQVLNAADYGVPQIRKRVFIVGFKNSELKFEFPKATHTGSVDLLSIGLKKWNPSKLALEHVEHMEDHVKRVHGDRVRNRYLTVPQGGRDKVDRTDRIDENLPSGTVLVGSKAGGGRPFIHPTEPRHITVREAARLQSFPDWYKFTGTSTWQYRAVGNAVPCLLAYEVGTSVMNTLYPK
jgi:DNA (cytosine-5)-methyltransferase 1